MTDSSDTNEKSKVESACTAGVSGEGAANRVVRIAVGSTNPAKLRSVETAFARAIHAPSVQLEVQGFEVDSNVSHQPFGDQETLLGAKNRAKAAYHAYTKQNSRPPHFAVGLEGGLEWISTEQCNDGGCGDDDDDGDYGDTCSISKKAMYCMAWMAVYGRRQAQTVDIIASPNAHTYNGDKKPTFGIAKTSNFPLPQPIVDLIVKKGLELGDADDQVFGRTKSKHGSGTVGILTNGLIDRSAYYEHALLLALTPWIRPDVFTTTA